LPEHDGSVCALRIGDAVIRRVLGILAFALVLVPACDCEVDVPGIIVTSTPTGGFRTILVLTVQANGDCPDPAAPPGVADLTYTAQPQSYSALTQLSFCVPRPDLLLREKGTLGTDVIVLSAESVFCSPSISGPGETCCGYTLSLVEPGGSASAQRACGTGTTPDSLTVSGRVRVESAVAGCGYYEWLQLSGTAAIGT